MTPLAPTTRLGFRAAAAALVALLVAQQHFLELQRPYWMILTSVLLVYDTAGESNQRALERLVTTALGCVAGFLLFHYTGSSTLLSWLVLLAGIFLAVYFRSNPAGVVYAPMVFCITLYVVFMFGMLGLWSTAMVLARVEDTAVGCVIALAVSAVILPQRAGAQFDRDLRAFRTSCLDHFEKAFSALRDGGPAPSLADRQALLLRLAQLRARSRTAAYETFPGRKAQRRRDRMNAAEGVCRHLLAFIASIPAIPSQKGIKVLEEGLSQLADRFRSGFRDGYAGEEESPAPKRDAESPAQSINQRALDLVRAGQLDRADFLAVSPAIYHLGEACRALQG